MGGRTQGFDCASLNENLLKCKRNPNESSRKRTQLGREKGVLNWIWQLTRINLICSIVMRVEFSHFKRGVKVRWPLTEASPSHKSTVGIQKTAFLVYGYAVVLALL